MSISPSAPATTIGLMDMAVTVGELFPAEDLIAQWVFQVTAVSEELSIIEKLMTTATRSEAPPMFGHFHSRQFIARAYEARRTVVVLEKQAALRTWVEQLPGIEDSLHTLRNAYLPPGDSTVDHLYGFVRHRTVHYSWVGSPELRAALLAAADEEAWAAVDPGAPSLHFEWPETVMAVELSGDLSQETHLRSLRARLRLLEAISAAFGDVSMQAFEHHARERVNIDPRRCVREIRARRG